MKGNGSAYDWAEVVKLIAPTPLAGRFCRPDPDGPVHVSMVAMSGREKKLNLPVLLTEHENPGKPAVLSDNGFIIPHEPLRKVIAAWHGENLRMGVNIKGVTGFTRFVEERAGDMYQTILKWLRAS